MTGGFTPLDSILLLVIIHSFLAWCAHVIFSLRLFAVFFWYSSWSILITILFLIDSSQGPTFPPTGKGSQVARKILSSIVAAKTIKVQSVLLMLCAISSVYSTIFISSFGHLHLNPSVVCLQAGIIVSYGLKMQCGCTVWSCHDKSFSTVYFKHFSILMLQIDCFIQRSRGR